MTESKNIDLDNIRHYIVNLVKKLDTQNRIIINNKSVYFDFWEKPVISTIPNSYVKHDILLKSDIIDSLHLVPLTGQNIKSYFEKIINFKPKIIATNIKSELLIQTSTSIFIHKVRIYDRCPNCDRYTKHVIKLECCTTKYQCTNCYKLEEKCNIDPNHEIKTSVDKYLVFNINCDLCKIKISPKIDHKLVYSSREYDIDICMSCSETEKGKDLIKKYDMIESPVVFLSLDYEFGSVFDWIPFCTDGKDNYIAICANKDNIYNSYYAIICKNYANDYEYTIMNFHTDNQLNLLWIQDNLTKETLLKIARRYHDYCKETQMMSYSYNISNTNILTYNRKNIDLSSI